MKLKILVVMAIFMNSRARVTPRSRACHVRAADELRTESSDLEVQCPLI